MLNHLLLTPAEVKVVLLQQGKANAYDSCEHIKSLLPMLNLDSFRSSKQLIG
ncbi:conserved hypothetical protein [Streptococcus equi subsp. zooepidemicus ATCC 35246]|nr:conserved hypothetical protein [Streptococcus equi subsp. zooepidemicus ATCC 35246]